MQQEEEVDIQMLHMQNDPMNLIAVKEDGKNLEVSNNQFSIYNSMKENNYSGII